MRFWFGILVYRDVPSAATNCRLPHALLCISVVWCILTVSANSFDTMETGCWFSYFSTCVHQSLPHSLYSLTPVQYYVPFTQICRFLFPLDQLSRTHVNMEAQVKFQSNLAIDHFHWCGRRQAACRKLAGSYDKTSRTAICFEHKTQYLSIRAPYTRIVVFWHISNIPPPWFHRVKLVVIPPFFV